MPRENDKIIMMMIMMMTMMMMLLYDTPVPMYR